MAKPSRPIARLTIAFGLVAIPVKLHSAVVAAERLPFHLLRKSDGSRVKEQFVAVNDGKRVERGEMVKGYEFAKNKHVMFTAEELKALEDSTSSTLEIAQFVPLESVDPVYFVSTYYLLPDKNGAKPYALFAAALREEARCAVGKWTSRGREHVIIIRGFEDGLALHQLHFQAEVRDLAQLGYRATKVAAAEIKLARRLIDHLAVERFDASAFADEHRARLRAEIKKKVQGKDISLAEPAPGAGRSDNVVSLMDALKASLQKRDRAGLGGKAAKRGARSKRKTA